ncbi:MAG: NfeD family protein [Clostridia bacterium]|nr:NfeD family protein [Clostridia bacterium]
MYPIIWLGVVIVFVATELATTQLTTIWFAGGALVAFALSFFDGINIWVQLVVFVLVSVILLIFTRPALIRLVEKNKVKTNVETVPGKIALVSEQIDNLQSKGAVDIAGITWTARAQQDDEIIAVGEKVVVLRVEGVKVIVKKV